ncbi:MAG: DedA family protein [Gammaproteobacteria bacterium]|nr:DedA family protein [Gammaproteobacteria bacterium]
MSSWAELGGLFVAAFLAATLLPGGSEALLLTLDIKSDWPDAVLLAVATLGNALGGMTSWLLGRCLPVDALQDARRQRAIAYIKRVGAPALLLSWVPLLGDPLCVAAGWLRIPWPIAFSYITLGKGLRYAALLWLL